MHLINEVQFYYKSVRYISSESLNIFCFLYYILQNSTMIYKKIILFKNNRMSEFYDLSLSF